ncbi:hypothetical protein Taro_042577 [Colocasia esculenta]|uniref:Uncharacterized protein n=1 Tax=Colocasia esculenta TaxID=4460 RepID=A0A843WPA2_COLES|nr:hypothetical protein [Colocasia esculenta]
MNATYRVVVFLNATVVLSPSGPFQHAAMQSAARQVDSTLAFERFTTNERIGDKGVTVIMNGDESNPEWEPYSQTGPSS